MTTSTLRHMGKLASLDPLPKCKCINDQKVVHRSIMLSIGVVFGK